MSATQTARAFGQAVTEPSSIVIVPYGAGVGDLALQRGLCTAVARHWPGTAVSVYAPPHARAYLPPTVRVVSRILGIPAWNRIAGAERWWRLLGPLEWRAIDLGMRRIPLQRLGRLPAQALAQRYDLVIDFLGTFVEGVDFARDWLPPEDGRETRHIVDLLADYLAIRGVELSPAARTEPLPVEDRDQRWAEAFLSSPPLRDKGAPSSSPVVLINPHAGSRLKLPAEPFWGELVCRLSGMGATPLVVAGGNAVEQAAARRAAGPTGIALPRMSLPRLVALARRCAVTVSPDTGLLHLVALAGGRWVGLFGSTNPYLTGPYDRSRGRLILAEPPRGHACLTCWQRFTLGSACCPVYDTGSCLSTLTAEAIAAATWQEAVAPSPG